jgi:hypothetical protein
VGRKDALVEKGGCCPLSLVLNNILVTLFSLSFQLLEDKKGEGDAKVLGRPEGGECAGVTNGVV